MKDKIIGNISQKTGVPDIAGLLAGRLSGSELNSLLLEMFSLSLQRLSPAELLKQYQLNRFVHPAETDMIGLLSLELKTLEFLRDHHFQPLELSPAAQLGSCSVIASVDQKKIVSATRNTEIMADATNAIALHIADLKKTGSKEGLLRFCTVHRHIRTQEIKVKGFTPHFKIGCMVSSGRDTVAYQFESAELLKQLATLDHLFRKLFGAEKIRFRIQKREGYEKGGILLDRVIGHLKKNMDDGAEILREDNLPPNNYYKGIQFKMVVDLKGMEIEIADGGFVDWTQQLLGNRKERLLISGFGLGLVYKLLHAGAEPDGE
jgi:hypothetical protein